MKAIFLTEAEAREFIAAEFGADATITKASVTSDTTFDIDKVPYAWDGEIEAYRVNGDSLVGFMEPKGAEYTVEFGDTTETATSHYAACRIADRIKAEAESGEIVIRCNEAAGFPDGIVETIDID